MPKIDRLAHLSLARTRTIVRVRILCVYNLVRTMYFTTQ